ncbi:hypothetical protein PGIGA_G00221280 [Pangasianodon gigas]|uniref:Uncharacterized protein n=1 Tax=Pangasianodon gigas TaxID=30993 RepID=A0ACC5WJP1_PANGG|nr:hypothetical protein [Pangasianodon gigas]
MRCCTGTGRKLQSVVDLAHFSLTLMLITRISSTAAPQATIIFNTTRIFVEIIFGHDVACKR